MIFATVLGCGVAFAQMSFQGLTPGSSTRNDVERVLGKPVRSISASEFEYKAPVGIAKVEVIYDSSGVQRIRAYFIQPITRAALLQKFSLPQEPDAKLNQGGKLLELFGGQAMLGLLYASPDSASGVEHLIYCSPVFYKNLIASLHPQTTSAPARAPATTATSVPDDLAALLRPLEANRAHVFTLKLVTPMSTADAKRGDAVRLGSVRHRLPRSSGCRQSPEQQLYRCRIRGFTMPFGFHARLDDCKWPEHSSGRQFGCRERVQGSKVPRRRR